MGLLSNFSAQCVQATLSPLGQRVTSTCRLDPGQVCRAIGTGLVRGGGALGISQSLSIERLPYELPNGDKNSWVVGGRFRDVLGARKHVILGSPIGQLTSLG